MNRSWCGQARRLRVVALLSLLLAVAACRVEGADSELLVDIPDANLRSAVEWALRKDSGEAITRREMASVDAIRAWGVADLTGISYAVNMNILGLSDSSISDLSLLAGLEALTWLHLSGEKIADLSPLGALGSLNRLSLNVEEIEDLSPLSGLTLLWDLNLHSNKIVDLSPLSGLTSLWSLDLAVNEVTDLSPLAGLLSLARLGLNVNDVADLSPLAGLGSLEALYLVGNDISEVEPLVRNAGLDHGDHIDLRGNWLSERSLRVDVPALRERGVSVLVDYERTLDEGESPVEIADPGLRTAIRRSVGARGVWPLLADEMARIQSIRGENEGIVNLAGIEFATDLRKLDLSRNAIADLAQLADLPLHSLHLDDNIIEDVAPLAGLVRVETVGPAEGGHVDVVYRLRVLTLRDNMIEDIGPLAELGTSWGGEEGHGLRDLALDGNRIGDLSPMPKQLSRLYLDDNLISDIAALSDQTHLWELQVAGNAITSIAPLAEMRNLRQLNFSDNQVEDLTPLTDLSLVEVHMKNNSVRDLSPLLGKEMWMVDVRNNRLSCDSVTDLRTLRDDGATVLAGEVVPFLATAGADREDFVRLINWSDTGGEVCIEAVDDAGVRHGPVRLGVGARQAVHFGAADLENGNVAKGIATGIGPPTAGDWRLEIVSSLDVEALSYVRTEDRFVASMHDVATEEILPLFNPGSDAGMRSLLRVVNTEEEPAMWMTGGYDDRGTWHPMDSAVVVMPGHALTLTTAQLEDAHGVGDGEGKWRFRSPGFPWFAMSLLASPSGHLTNLSSVPDNAEALADGTSRYRVPLFLAAESEREGFLRMVNRSKASGQVAVHATDDQGNRFGPVYLDVRGGRTVHFTSSDLEAGNAAKGLSGGVGRGDGDWRLTLTSELDLQVLSYVRTEDGFVTSMHDLAPRGDDGAYRVVFFNPGSNTEQVSKLRLVNSGDEMARVTVTGIDDEGADSGTVALTVPAMAARTFTAAELEEGSGRVSGSLGDGGGKWRLRVDADTPLAVMSLLENPTGHLVNVSTGTAD